MRRSSLPRHGPRPRATPKLAEAQNARSLQKQNGSSDGDFGAEVDVLNGVQELDAFFQGTLEGFASRDEAGAAGALVDDGSGNGFFEILRAGGAAAVDQACA